MYIKEAVSVKKEVIARILNVCAFLFYQRKGDYFMKKLSKLSFVLAGVFLTSVVTVSSVWGYNALRKVDATANDNIKIYYDGKLQSFTEADGSKISPVIINGRTYLPLRAVADLAGMGVEWDGKTETIYLSSNNSGIPYKDNTPVVTSQPSTSTGTNTPAPASPKASTAPVNTSKSAGTLQDPVKLGETYSWSASEEYLGTTASADYTYVVKKVEPITLSQIAALGFKTDSDDAKFDYVIITCEQTVSNAKIASGEAYLSLPFYRSVFGSKTASGKSIIGGTDYGFDGSMKSNMDLATQDSEGFNKKIKAGEVYNFKVEGKIIVPLTKGEENYFVITKDESLEYSKSHLYFALK